MMINTITLLLGATLLYSTPMIFGALGGVLSERSGVINIGIEGMMTFGAFAGAAAGYYSGSPWIGVAINLPKIFGSGAEGIWANLNVDIMVVVALSFAVAMWFVFYRTKWGMQILTMLPYVLTIVILILFVGKSVAPKADGVPYVKGRR